MPRYAPRKVAGPTQQGGGPWRRTLPRCREVKAGNERPRDELLRKCSNEQRMIALSTSLFRSPADNLTHCTETKQLRPLNNRQCRFDNGFHVVQNRRPSSLSRGTSNGTTPSSHRTFSSSSRRPRRPFPKIIRYFLFGRALSGRRVVPARGRLGLANQGACRVLS